MNNNIRVQEGGNNMKGWMRSKFTAQPEKNFETNFGVNALVNEPGDSTKTYVQVTFHQKTGETNKWLTLNITKEEAINLADRLLFHANRIADDANPGVHFQSHSFNLLTHEPNL